MAFPTVAPRTAFQLTLLDESATSLGAYELLSFSGGGYKFNVTSLKPYGSATQNFKGDGTPIIDHLTLDIKVDGARSTAMATLLTRLSATRGIQLDSGPTLSIAAAVGITSWAPLGYSSSRVTIELIPTTNMWSDNGIAVV
jgi:hypothetical protein